MEITLFGRTFFPKAKPVLEERSFDLPEKVFVEKEGDYTVTSEMSPIEIKGRLNELLYGEYSSRNFIELFYALPEIFAPIHEIASRVSDANWQLRKTWNDEIDYNNADFNRLFSQPNPLTGMKEFIYQAVCYEILTGKQLWHFNNAVVFDEPAKNIINWWNLPAHRTLAKCKKNIDPYTSITIEDIAESWCLPVNGKNRFFSVKDVLAVLHLSLNSGTDLNKVTSMLLGASKAIKNLIPVYEARGIIYINRGAMGFLVSAKKDADGTKALTAIEKKDIREEANRTYGLQKGKSTIGVTDQPIDFVKTSMSIAEMLPFDETLADASAIYATLRVPGHLIPSKDKSTFNNASTDMKSFYEDVIQPWAKKYGDLFAGYMKFDRRYIVADFTHISYLQNNKKEESDANKTDGDTWEQRFHNGVCSLNEWIVAIDGNKGVGPMYEKKLFEMTPEELSIVSEVISLKTKSNGNQQETGSKDKGAQASSKASK